MSFVGDDDDPVRRAQHAQDELNKLVIKTVE